MFAQTAENPIRLAIIGAGNIGKEHVKAADELDGATVTFIGDEQFDCAVALATRVPSSIATNQVGSIFQSQEVDGVIVATPTTTHKNISIAALRAGKHVLCEKPMSRFSYEARKMIDVADATGNLLMIGHVVRFAPEYQEIERQVQNGAIGKPLFSEAYRLNGYPGNWYKDTAQSGGEIMDLAIHDVDWTIKQFGNPVDVSYQVIGDDKVATLKYADGFNARIRASWNYPTNGGTGITIYGTDGIIAYRHHHEKPALVLKKYGEAPQEIAYPRYNMYAAQLAGFVESIRNSTPIINSGKDGLATLLTVERILASEGKQVYPAPHQSVA